jgi:hypothetical protein
MWCGKKCGAKGKTPSFIEVFAVITPHIIWRSQCFEKAHDAFATGTAVIQATTDSKNHKNHRHQADGRRCKQAKINLYHKWVN